MHYASKVATCLLASMAMGCGLSRRWLSDTNSAKAEPEEERIVDEGEGAPGYLTSPDLISSIADFDRGFITIDAPAESVVARRGALTELEIKVAFASVEALKDSTVTSDGGTEIAGAVLLATLPVGEDGSFSGEVPLPGAGMVVLTLESWDETSSFSVKKAESGAQVSTILAPLLGVLGREQLTFQPAQGSGLINDILLEVSEAGMLRAHGIEVGYAKSGSVWTRRMTFPTGGIAPYRYALVESPADAQIDRDSGEVTYTPVSVGDATFTVRVTDGGGSTADHRFVLTTNDFNLCVWSGAVDTAWTSPANWHFCNGTFPQLDDAVGIDAAPINQPTLAAEATIDSIGPSVYNGGTLTIQSGARLTLTNTTLTIGSSIEFQGDSTTCPTCWVFGAFEAPFVIANNAIVTLGNGVGIVIASREAMYLGDGTTGATLRTVPSVGKTQAEYPRFESTGAGYAGGIKVRGTSDNPSVIDIDGAFFRLPYAPNMAIEFIEHFSINTLRNITFQKTYYDHSPTIALRDCSTGQVNSKVWDNLVFRNLHTITADEGANISASGAGCLGLGAITISGDGLAYGSQFEDDPYGVINWVNDEPVTCTWTGAVDQAWETPGNWSNCINGRQDVPGSADWVIIPPSTVQPFLSYDAAIQGFGLGTGGGVLTANIENLFVLNETQSIRSSVTTRGLHIVSYGHLTIADGAVVTLEARARVYLELTAGGGVGDSALHVGDGATSGHLVVNGGSAEVDWPLIGGYGCNGVIVTGSALAASSVDITGLRTSSCTAFDFVDNYSIVRFDAVSIQPAAPASSPSIRLSNCASASFGSATWTGFTFDTAYTDTGMNVDASACSGVNISIPSAQGPGAGATYSSDPNGVLTWD